MEESKYALKNPGFILPSFESDLSFSKPLETLGVSTPLIPSTDTPESPASEYVGFCEPVL